MGKCALLIGLLLIRSVLVHWNDVISSSSIRARPRTLIVHQTPTALEEDPMRRALFTVAAALIAIAQTATADDLAVVPTHVHFGRQVFETNTLATFTITNRSAEELLVT